MNMADAYRALSVDPAWLDLLERLESDIETEMHGFFEAEDRVDAEEFRLKIRIKKEFVAQMKTIVANTKSTKKTKEVSC